MRRFRAGISQGRSMDADLSNRPAVRGLTGSAGRGYLAGRGSTRIQRGTRDADLRCATGRGLRGSSRHNETRITRINAPSRDADYADPQDTTRRGLRGSTHHHGTRITRILKTQRDADYADPQDTTGRGLQGSTNHHATAITKLRPAGCGLRRPGRCAGIGGDGSGRTLG
jgi:hypothetical protein